MFMFHLFSSFFNWNCFFLKNWIWVKKIKYKTLLSPVYVINHPVGYIKKSAMLTLLFLALPYVYFCAIIPSSRSSTKWRKKLFMTMTFRTKSNLGKSVKIQKGSISKLTGLELKFVRFSCCIQFFKKGLIT